MLYGSVRVCVCVCVCVCVRLAFSLVCDVHLTCLMLMSIMLRMLASTLHAHNPLSPPEDPAIPHPGDS